MMSTPDISDKFPDLPCLVGLNSYGARSVFEGEVVTVVCPDDNSLAKELISQKGDGKILFIEGNASKAVALLGDNLAQQALDNNWSGIIVNGMVRDVEILRSIPLAIYARGSCPKKATKIMQGILTLIFVLTVLILSRPFGPMETRMAFSSPLPSLSSNYIYS